MPRDWKPSTWGVWEIILRFDSTIIFVTSHCCWIWSWKSARSTCGHVARLDDSTPSTIKLVSCRDGSQTTAGNVVLEAHGWIRFAPTTNLPLLTYGDVQSLGHSGVKQSPSNSDELTTTNCNYTSNWMLPVILNSRHCVVIRVCLPRPWKRQSLKAASFRQSARYVVKWRRLPGKGRQVVSGRRLKTRSNSAVCWSLNLLCLHKQQCTKYVFVQCLHICFAYLLACSDVIYQPKDNQWPLTV